MALQGQALEQLQSTYCKQNQQLVVVKAEASQLLQEVGQKCKRIEALEWHGTYQERKVSTLEHRVQEYKRICTYVARESQVRSQTVMSEQATSWETALHYPECVFMRLQTQIRLRIFLQPHLNVMNSHRSSAHCHSITHFLS